MRTISIQFLIFGATFMMIIPVASASESTTKVTTYVVQTQEEREQTRWTLTQWLRIKERMKLMDVWLAMFSEPSKDRFRPELNISLMRTKSAMELKVDGNLTDEGSSQGSMIKSQLWLTNLISSNTGIRMINIDLGLEGGHRDSGRMVYSVDSTQSASNVGAATHFDQSPSALTNWYTLNFRLFGKHIQDSSLVLKYGFMETKNSFYLPITPGVIDRNTNAVTSSAGGTIRGGELQVYLTHALGLEGTVHQYSATTVAYADHKLEGSYGDALLFVEISCLRLQGGIYEERWFGNWADTTTKTKESGYVGGLKLLL